MMPALLTPQRQWFKLTMAKANDTQVGGDHYRKFGDLQHWDVVKHFKLGYLEGCATKYIFRHRDKNGAADIRKAIHYLEKLLEQEYPQVTDSMQGVDCPKCEVRIPHSHGPIRTKRR